MRRRHKLPPGPPEVENFALPAAEWNRVIEQIARARPLMVQGARETGVPYAWRTTAARDAAGWKARVGPGFVNGSPAWIGDAELMEPGDLRIPEFRPSTDVPEWFTERWTIRTPRTPELVLTDLGAAEVVDPAAVQIAARRLYEAHVVLSVQRPTTRIELEPTRGEYIARLDSAGSNRAKVAIAVKDADRPGTVLEQIAGGQQDTGMDSIRLATVYALSAEFWNEDQPDEAAQLFVRQEVFWNLNHGIRRPNWAKGESIVRLGDLFPWARDLINGVILDMQLRQSLTDALGAETMIQGRFWTA